MTVGGQRYTTTANGDLVLTAPVALGADLEASAERFAVRETYLRSEPVLSLWPRSSPSGLTEALSLEMVFVFFNAQRMIRLAPEIRRVHVVPSAELAADPQAAAAIQNAAAVVTAALEGSVEFVVGEPGAGAAEMRAHVDPASAIASTGAGALREMRGYAVMGGEVVFKGVNNARFVGIVVHEIGHLLGFVHSSDSRDIMGPGPGLRGDFSAREKVLLRLMWQRLPGTRFPDNDRGLSAAGSRRSTLAVSGCLSR